MLFTRAVFFKSETEENCQPPLPSLEFGKGFLQKTDDAIDDANRMVNMKEITKYQANDGTVFDDEMLCRSYEKDCINSKHIATITDMIKFYESSEAKDMSNMKDDLAALLWVRKELLPLAKAWTRREKEWQCLVERLTCSAFRLMQLADGAEVEEGVIGMACKEGHYYEEIAQQRIKALRRKIAVLESQRYERDAIDAG